MEKVCCVCGASFSCHFDGKPYCNRHYQSMTRYGSPNGSQRKSKNQFVILEGRMLIVTTAGDVIIADPQEKEKLEKYSWCVSKTGYAVANMRGKVVKMHRFIIGLDECAGKVVDHINRDRLDNRRSNLRVCTDAENHRNKSAIGRSGYLGIRLTDHGKYNVRITHNRQEIHVGNFDTIEEAIKARAEAEDKYHGEYGSRRSGGAP